MSYLSDPYLTDTFFALRSSAWNKVLSWNFAELNEK